MNRNTLRLLWVCLPLVSMFILNGCNTVQGMGDDMSAAGKAISKEADKNKGY
jgi:predicted small secreted protein